MRGLEEKLDYAQETLAADDPLLLWMTFLKHPESLIHGYVTAHWTSLPKNTSLCWQVEDWQS
ncbi:MAG: hypothetical protein LBU15_02535 [Rickettsiales bacterium]|nr:hypothetical protein [Rickettsiales bacterium]